jgi:hypothetical protein
MRVIIHPALPNPPALPIPAGHPPGQATSTAPFRRISLIPEEATLGQIRAFLALHNLGCSWGLKPPVSSRDLAM